MTDEPKHACDIHPDVQATHHADLIDSEKHFCTPCWDDFAKFLKAHGWVTHKNADGDIEVGQSQ